MRFSATTVVSVLAVVLAGTASAAGWRDLRVDASSEEAFAKSLESFKDELSPERLYVFGEALKEIWIQGEKTAEALKREYTPEDYYAQVDGLGYDEIVTFADPTGDTAKARYRIAMSRSYRPSHAYPTVPRTNDVYPRPDGPGHRG